MDFELCKSQRGFPQHFIRKPLSASTFHFQFEDFYISFFNYWQPTAEIMYDLRPQVWLEDLLESIFSAQNKLFD